MSDGDGKGISDKEKESALQNEKEKDTSKDGNKSAKSKATTPKSKSPAGSKPGSGVKSPKPAASARSDKKGTPTPRGKGKSKVEKVSTPAPSSVDGGADDVLPENAVPLFMTSKTQEIFGCRCDEDVSQEMPFKLIPKQEILDDFRNRAGVCDFTPIKKDILDYPGDEILVVYDYDFKFGQNFYVALTEETKEKLLNPPHDKDGADTEGGLEEEDLEPVIYKYIPPEAKPWISFGSEVEIYEETVKENREKVKVLYKRKRKEFGAPVTFSDRDVNDAKDGYIECVSYEDKNFNLKKMELDKGLQAIPESNASGTQTDWTYPRNANTQYYPREFSEEQQKKMEADKNLQNFLNDAAPRFELALQQNEIMNVFYNDWLHLGDDENTLGSKADNHLKEYQSFTDLQFSKDKKITCIQWHPTIKGVVAVAVSQRLSFDDRVDHGGKIIMNPSLILIWSFTDPIHPQLLLEAPDDIYSFQWCPSDANILAGGCYNGQVVLWDISAVADRLKQRGQNKVKKTTVLPGFEDPNALKTPVVRYCAVSSIEHSHKARITDIMWVPDHMEINKLGEPKENKNTQCVQLMTCATDHCVLIWDTRPIKIQQTKDDDKGPKNPMGVPNTFRHLDLTWKPLLKVQLHKSEPGGDHSPTKFTIHEKQGTRPPVSKVELADKESSTTGGFSYNKPASGKEKKTLQDVKTHFYVATEDGEVVYVDWMPQKDQDTGKIQTPKPDYYHTIHDGPVSTLQRSPFFKDIVLSIGGWTLAIWKEGVTSGPILHSCADNIRLTGGHWSPSRPGVFFVAKADGSVDVWDLLDKTHEASMNQSISATAITTLFPHQVTQKQQLLAVGDNSGTLHILEIPWSLRHPTNNEQVGVYNYFEREIKRRGFVVERWDFREKEKREIEAEAKRKAGIAPNVVLTDEEIEIKQKIEYQNYLDEEASFLRELGLLKEEAEPLPEI
ncbi:hypothetical protein LOTGIDRAFT_199692 [Lottia gigantea]|uniref:WD repeat-containing protein 63 n=1 Tax=Lottia gigantea TaxID=225164 RepID=V4AEL6_LOTGI|nr:hypothetical protein LOTGIDRAFT_199692 [Lottia gigantea]ESP02449.1 hypothetical protein LOTGIDRAFT_199692 [Lottia gigantea]